MGVTPRDFESCASTIPPLRQLILRGKKPAFWPGFSYQRIASILEDELIVKSMALVGTGIGLGVLASGTFLRALWMRTLPGAACGWPYLAQATAHEEPAHLSGRPGQPRRPQFDEEALIAAARRGDLPAFNQLILSYQGTAFNVAYRLLNDHDSAADATQEGFLKAYRRLDQYRGGSFKAWILRIITNTCYDVLRAHRRRPTVALESDEESDGEHDAALVDAAERPDDYAQRRELAAAIQAAISQLPIDQRTVIVLSDVEGMNYQEIAEATGAALGTVKSRLSRARSHLRDILLLQKELLPAQYRLT